ncbi:Glycosyltransferase family 4 protein [Sulfidibacter corallicola]|uniref:Glycosyltransferase family 4 protein n=1 Tax=Sulfidibacter corallicola TaxID=2818388 RepID=A0A8A4TVU4_SULCO|nr:glycosyltransferase family 4 protein [Sulfidibacter corallicola]QTD54059.1 glycosyltransferase family 4 protein [Sulfidibacter corallicola]
MNILILTRYPTKGPSSRYRFLQYLPQLTAAGHHFEIRPFFTTHYLETIYSGKRPNPLYVMGRYLARLGACLRARRFDLVWMEGELLPLIPAPFERALHALLPPRRIYDFDDAVWLRYKGKPFLERKFLSVLRGAAGIVCGNPWLENYCRQVNERIIQIPTVVDWPKYAAAEAPLEGCTIGWIGSPSTLFFLENLYPALRRLAAEMPLRLHIVGAESSDPELDITCSSWSEAAEVSFIERFDIGVMPLDPTPWAEGKCGLKLIQYMAAGVPAVASPVGVNTQLIEGSGGGYLAGDEEAWVTHLGTLLSDGVRRRQCGLAGRAYAQEHLTVQAQGPKLISFLEETVRGQG